MPAAARRCHVHAFGSFEASATLAAHAAAVAAASHLEDGANTAWSVHKRGAAVHRGCCDCGGDG